MTLVFHPRYDVTFWGLEGLHPFDSRKYGRAFRALGRPEHVRVDRPATAEELGRAHTSAHLASLRSPRTLAQALEIPLVAVLPWRLTDWRVLTPMRWAVRGTELAARAALADGLGINLSGGYHHAKPDRGEGFCVYADAALAVAALRASGELTEDARVWHVDVDAHMGNGLAVCAADDDRWTLVDVYNGSIYPADPEAAARIDVDRPIAPGTSDGAYLSTVREALAQAMAGPAPALAFVNAGTDVLSGDPLGGLDVSAAAILERDTTVVGTLRDAGIPTVVLPSGGYTSVSYELIATSVAALRA